MGCFLEKDCGNIYIKISPYQNLAGIWTQIKRRVKISSINFGNFSNYKCYFVSVGREIGRTMFLTQKVGSKYGSKYSNMMQFMQKHTYLQLFLKYFVVFGSSLHKFETCKYDTFYTASYKVSCVLLVLSWASEH